MGRALRGAAVVERADMAGQATQPIERKGRVTVGRNGFALGDVLADTYELRDLRASGDDHDLFDAYDRQLGRDVQIKLVTGSTPRDNLRREARMLAPLTHPGIATVYGYGSSGSAEYLVTERVHGTTLAEFRDLRASRGGLAIREATSILIGIAEALAVMHANGYVHGRLTANAIVLANDGRIVVRDPMIVGEVVPGETGDASNDMTALGFLAYQLFTGKVWAGESVHAVPMPLEASRILAELLPVDGRKPPSAVEIATSLRGEQRVVESSRPLTIVVADDDADIRDLLALALSTAVPHASVHLAADGVAAIDLVEKHRPDLLLLDLEMPRLDGIGVCTFVRGTYSIDQIAICVMSKHAAKNRAVLARLGVIDAFQKGDVPPADVPRALAALLRRLRLIPEAKAPEAMIGGRYELGRQLGSGGMGMVHEVRHRQLGRPLALKMISPQYALDAAARARFLQEARLASEIVHPNLVSVIDYGEDRHIGPYMVMELMSGESLADLAKAKLSLRRGCELLGQVADALMQIHARGIVHGDIKAENIVVVEELVGSRRRRLAKLIDFGLARRVTNMATTSDTITGTPHYVAPERASGAAATIASDVYALGILGYLIIAGSLPFEGTATEIMLDHVNRQPDPLADRRGEPVDSSLQTLISRALSKDVKHRHPTATAFRYELNNALDMLELSNRNARVAARVTLWAREACTDSGE